MVYEYTPFIFGSGLGLVHSFVSLEYAGINGAAVVLRR